MKKTILKIIWISLAAVGIVIGGGVYLTQTLPVLPEPPDIKVMGVPDTLMQKKAEQAYQGMHPRQSDRPQETFTFPVALGATGPVDPLYAGTNQYPFLCGADSTREEGTQPEVDNQLGIGIPVYASGQEDIKHRSIIGYSKDCSYPTHAQYYYKRKGSTEFFPLAEAKDDIEKITIEGREIDFIVRLETGTINRFIYAIAVLKGADEQIAKPVGTYWNQRLVYQFRGGVGIGKRQGNFASKDVLRRRSEQLAQGYAIVYSTANQTSNHYNIWLAEDTARRVKKQFVGLYGQPLYTVGIGGSGGAIQQYLFAQNSTGILDAAIPLYSYPDMVSQTIYVMDCEPLEYYFDVVGRKNPLWRKWENRSLIEGVNADSSASNKYLTVSALATLLKGDWSALGENLEGATECVTGWRGLVPLVHNPRFVHFMSSYTPEVANNVHWTHWDDLKQFYGVNQHGFANSTWDNVGVQYGLDALKSGKLSIDEFIKINAHVGGWKTARDMEDEKLWILGGELLPVKLSFWSHQNMHFSHDGGETPAPRTEGSLEAIAGAYRSGHVFVGYADIPIIDLRHYLDDDLDMHHATASFSARARLLAGQGHADNQLIWMSAKPYEPQAEAFAMIERWMLNILINPEKSVVENRPSQATDRCFDRKGRLIAAGDTVWNGDWNGQPAGACMAIYPRHKTSREIAGGGVKGDVFKCHLQSVSDALQSGVYGDVDMWPHQRRMETVFPQGVCDYTLGDLGKPFDLLKPRVQVASVKQNSVEATEKTDREAPPKNTVPVKDNPKTMTLSKLEGEEKPGM